MCTQYVYTICGHMSDWQILDCDPGSTAGEKDQDSQRLEWHIEVSPDIMKP